MDDKERVALSLIHNTSHLETALQTIEAWTISQPSNGKRVKLVYAGAEETKVQTILDRLNPSFDVELRPYLNQEDYYSLLKSSRANLYIRSEKTFHHKVFELMAARRAVICYPAETEEVMREAKERRSRYYSCKSADDILEALKAAAVEPQSASDESLFQLDWRARSEVLERVLQSHIF